MILSDSSTDENGNITFAIVFNGCNRNALPIICMMDVFDDGKCIKQTPFVIGASKPSTNIFTFTKKAKSPLLNLSILFFLFNFDVSQSIYSDEFGRNVFNILFIFLPSFCVLQ